MVMYTTYTNISHLIRLSYHSGGPPGALACKGSPNKLAVKLFSQSMGHTSRWASFVANSVTYMCNVYIAWKHEDMSVMRLHVST